MDIHDFLREFLLGQGREELYRKYENFFTLYQGEEYDPELTASLLGNVKFKRALAKYVASRFLTRENYLLQDIRSIDTRLECFIMYYILREILNGDMPLAEADKALHEALGNCHVGKGSYLPGTTVYSDDTRLPVRMTPRNDLHRGYRTFIVNMLCFDADRFLMGIRCDSGPVPCMKYHKGCAPAGVRRDEQMRTWTLFKVDKTLTDDNTAIFSNGLDGDGTIEVCDWISPKDVRVIFRVDI